jgi:two-component system, LytTR family, sensor kinase
MKSFSFPDIVNLRKPVSHLLIVSFSLVITLFMLIINKEFGNPYSAVSLFIILVTQLEAFIFIGNLLFAKVNFDRSPADITRLILVRFVIFISGCLLFSLGIYLLLQYSVALIRGNNLSDVTESLKQSGLRTWFKSTIKGLTFGGIVFVVLLWQTSLRREQRLREENLIFQNETLKSQVNPHFLFNSLNTISSLIHSQPEAADRFIQNMSSVYRYILENGQKDKVPLKAELNFLTDYFSLHRVRDDEKILLSIDVPDPERYEIVPVSLQILLENAIKHNIATRESKLRISVTLEGNSIVVRNNLQRKATQLKSTNIGLRNLSERIRLRCGRELVVEEALDQFIVKLPLL